MKNHALACSSPLCAMAAPIASRSRACRPLRGRRRTRGLTEVAGLKVGHHTLAERPTGCTVILVEGDGAVGGVSQRGGAPGTRETDLLHPLNMVDRVNAIVLAGGSAFGLDAAQGVVRYLEERNIGYKTAPGSCRLCRRPSSSTWGSATTEDSADRRLRLSRAAAASDGPVAEGNVGAGAGATVGKLGGGRAR